MPYKRKITGIYKIQNIVNNKVYIGSAKSILSRFSVHKRTLKNNCHFNKHLQSSYNIHGINNFVFEIIEEIDINNKELIQEREEFYISYYKSNDKNFGYNCRIKCNTNLGKKLSPEHIQKLKISHLGIKRTKECNEKIRKSQYKPVYKLNINKEIITRYESLIEAGEKNNIHRQSISSCCRGKLNSTGGFYWCFVDDYPVKEFKKIRIREKNHNYIYENLKTNEKVYRLIDVSRLLNIDVIKLHYMFSGRLKNKTDYIRYEI